MKQRWAPPPPPLHMLVFLLAHSQRQRCGGGACKEVNLRRHVPDFVVAYSGPKCPLSLPPSVPLFVAEAQQEVVEALVFNGYCFLDHVRVFIYLYFFWFSFVMEEEVLQKIGPKYISTSALWTPCSIIDTKWETCNLAL